MQDGDLFPEDSVQIGGHPRRQADFGHQQNRPSPRFEDLPHRRQVDRCLARTGDPVEQDRLELARFDAPVYSLQSLLLLRREEEIDGVPWLHGRQGERRRLFQNLDESSPDQRGQRGFRKRESPEFLHRQPAFGGAQMRHDLLLIGIQLARRFILFQAGNFYASPGIARARKIFAGDPLFCRQVAKYLPRSPGGGAQRRFANQFTFGQII